MITHSPYVPLDVLATTLGLPHAWLRRETEAACLPCIRAGRYVRFDVQQVREHLRSRAIRETKTREEVPA